MLTENVKIKTGMGSDVMMKMFVGVTDNDWFNTVKKANCEEVNFWRPSGQNFKALNINDMFLFKLHSPYDYIVGGGFFVDFSILPSSLAWEAFGIENGVRSLDELKFKIKKYRKKELLKNNPNIGCVILSPVFYFEEKDWIPVPKDWSKNIVQGKTYDISSEYGSELFEIILERLRMMEFNDYNPQTISENRYGKELKIKPRLGQGAFKVLVTNAYKRRCAITGEKTLPVLEAAHIRPYSLEGPHEVKNGLLLRRDFHTLFDRGYITIDKNLYVVVSHRIKEDGNGKEYYAHHGKQLIILPEYKEHQPDLHYLEWHNKNIYIG